MIIDSFLPNPIGKDIEGEWIVIKNNGDEAVLLHDWVIRDAGGKQFRLSGFLGAGERRELPYVDTKIVLNNNGESLFLIDAQGVLRDELSYVGVAAEGRVVSRADSSVSSEALALVMDVWPEPPAVIVSSTGGEVVVIFTVVAFILSFLSLYVIKQFEKNERFGGAHRP